jgi:hypothetical protein
MQQAEPGNGCGIPQRDHIRNTVKVDKPKIRKCGQRWFKRTERQTSQMYDIHYAASS